MSEVHQIGEREEKEELRCSDEESYAPCLWRYVKIIIIAHDCKANGILHGIGSIVFSKTLQKTIATFTSGCASKRSQGDCYVVSMRGVTVMLSI